MTAETSPVTPNDTDLPTIHVITDSVGATAKNVARAAAAQFGTTRPHIELCSQVKCSEDIERYLDEHSAIHREQLGDDTLVVFYTLASDETMSGMQHYLAAHPNIIAVDLLTPAVDALSRATGRKPSGNPKLLYVTDENYFNRIEAMEFTIAHDDGANPQDLPQADIVLLGVSRCSKTPTSIYLSQLGYKVANVPLDLQTDPPHEIYDVPRGRLFGLTTTPEVLVDIRRRRLGNAQVVAGSYADPEMVYRDLESARAFMRKLGCIVINTGHRAIEETAQEILRYYVPIVSK
ncbi:MAG: pyruvate, water dikinase regulatory protein [Eggerthellaceae bacterium]|jgi:regulator of PEP synthase PpsR (kinase-PPPase family)